MRGSGRPRIPSAQGTVPDAHDPSKRHAPMMLTTDLALRMDPIYAPIAKRFHEHPDQLADAFAQGVVQAPRTATWDPSRATSARGFPEPQLWQDPVPDGRPRADRRRRHRGPEERRSSPRDCRSPGWSRPRGRPPRASAAPTSGVARTERGFASRHNATGRSTTRASSPRCCRPSSRSSRTSTARSPVAARVSLADVIVLGGCAAVEQAAKNAGYDVTVPFAPGRTDASQEQTDVESFAVLEPTADGFRNYLRAGEKLPPEQRLLDRANLLTLTAPEMTVLVGGMRALNTNHGRSAHGVFTDRPESLTNDFFVNLLDMGTEWKPSASVGERLRRSRSSHRRGQVDRHRRRPGLRLELPAPGARGGLRQRRLEGEVRARLRGRVGQGHEPRSLRPELEHPAPVLAHCSAGYPPRGRSLGGAYVRS